MPRIAPHVFVLLSFLAAFPVAAQGETGFSYVKDEALISAAGVVVIDTRALQACTGRSLPEARCLPASDVLGPHGRLASISDILWLFGTVDLDGSEHLLVAGDDAVERDFVAGLLYLAGQRRVSVLTQPISRITARDGARPASGTERSNTRERVYQAAARDGLLVLRGELAGLQAAGRAPVLLDGRSEKEYWGETIRGLRGGHIPGAQSLVMPALRSAIANGRGSVPTAVRPVAYGHDAVESIAFFTLLRAGAGVDVRVFPDGWVDWAAHTNLPVDSVTYLDRALTNKPTSRLTAPEHGVALQGWIFLAVALAAGAVLAASGFYLGRRNRA